MASQGTRQCRRGKRAHGSAAPKSVQAQCGAAVSTESRPCEEQAQAAIQRADCAWESGPRRMRELCGEYPDRAGWPTGGSVPVQTPDGGSEFSPGPTDSQSDTDSSDSSDLDSSDPETRDSEPPEAESEDPEPSEAESEDSASSDVEARSRGLLTSDSSSSDSSSSDSEEWDSFSADSGFTKPSSSDTEGEIIPSAPPLEEIEEISRTVAGLSGRAMRQVRKLLTMLAQMRKDLSPSARIEAVKELGWRLGSSREAERAGEDNHGPEPTQPSGEGGRLMKYLEDWQRICGDGEERRGAAREEVVTPDDGLSCAEERLPRRGQPSWRSGPR
jgi:hypothetical protein